MEKAIYTFGQFELDPGQKRLRCDGESIPLQPKVFDVLVAFAERAGQLVSRDELMEIVWADTFVEESNLRFCIHSLRKTLGKDKEGNDYIETVPTRGYRFLAEITTQNVEDASRKNGNEAADKVFIPDQKRSSSRTRWTVAVGALAVLLLATAAFVWLKRAPAQQGNPVGIGTLAVLPFAQVGDQPELGTSFSAGLADVMSSALAKIRDVKVLPLGEVQKVTGRNLDTLGLGRELGAGAVLEGSYRIDAGQVRITSRLVRVSDGELLWTDSFVADRSTSLKLEDTISLRIARLLSIKFAEGRGETIKNADALDREAVRNYIEGRKIWRLRELNRRDEMIRLFEKAIEFEPGWSLAYSGLAEALLNEDANLFDGDRIETAARKALELDNRNAQAHNAMAQVYRRKHWDWENAEKAFREAISIDPGYAHAHHEYGILLGIERRFVEADREVRTAIELDPFSPFYNASLCELSYYDRRYDDALAQCAYAENLEPDFWRTRKQFFWIYVQKRMYPEMSEMVLSKVPAGERANHLLTKALIRNDLRPFWQDLITARQKLTNDSWRSLALATFYLQIDDKEKALDALEQSAKDRELLLPTANADPIFDPIRRESRFLDIMRKAGL
jgi:DNA-binding winged helix-turn-helix (wHTH) protein/TolB-like protein